MKTIGQAIWLLLVLASTASASLTFKQIDEINAQGGSTLAVPQTGSNLLSDTATQTLGSGSTWHGVAVGLSYGGTGQTTQQAAEDAVLGGASTGQYTRYNGTHWVASGISSSDVPTLNQNTTGSASSATNISGGSTNSIPYQTSSGATSFLSPSPGFLQYSGGTLNYSLAPQFTTQPFYDSSTNAATTSFVQSAINYSMATQNLANVTGGTYSYASLGSAAAVNFTASAGVITTVNSIAAAGSGYAVGDLVTVSGGNQDAILRVATLSGSGIATVTILNGGTGYTTSASSNTINAQSVPFTYILTGTLTSDATFIMTNGTNLTQSNQWIFVNNTTGSHNVSVFISNGSDAATGTGVTIVQGSSNSTSSLIQSDGVSDVWFGDSLNGLANVSAPTPNLNDVLQWNGLKWVNAPAAVSSVGNAVTVWNTTPVVTATGTNNANELSTLAYSPVTSTRQTIASSLVSNTLLNSAWVTASAMNENQIAAGTWTFNLYAGTSATNGGRVTTATENIYQVVPGATGGFTVTTTGSGTTRTATTSGAAFVSGDASATNTSAGFLQTPQGLYQITAYTSSTVVSISVPSGYSNESAVQYYKWARLFGATSAAITSISPTYALNTWTSTQSSFAVATTDYLGSIIFGTGNNTLTFTIAYNDSTNSNIQTTLTPLHNNLAGLQGGSSNQYYHLTSAEYVGSGSGVFARVSAPSFTSASLGGSSTATTQATYDNSTLVATDAFVQSAVNLSMATAPLSNITGGIYSFASAGSGASLTVVASGGVITSISSVAAPGSGYKVGDIITPVAGNNDAFVRVASLSGSGVLTTTLLYGGTGYSSGTVASSNQAVSVPFTFTLSGTLTSDANFVMTNGSYLTESNQWIFNNNTTGAHLVTVQISNGSDTAIGTGVTIPQGSSNSAPTLAQTDGVSDVWFGDTPRLTSGHIYVGTTAGLAGDVAMSGDVTISGNGTATLAASGVTSGSYTNANITVDAKGRVTVASNGSGGSGTAIQEAPSGTCNGSTTAFTLAHTPTSNAVVLLHRDGSILTQGAGLDYTISSATITLGAACATGQKLWASYTY